MKTFARINEGWLEGLEIAWEGEVREVACDLKQTTEAGGLKKLVDVGASAASAIIKSLEDTGNYRSAEMQADLRKTATLMDRIINGEVDPKYYLCDLPTGSGKTSLIAYYVTLLCLKHPDEGVLICVPHLREIEELVDRLTDLNVTKSQIYVYTSHDKANALGCPHDKGNDASICITTQQMVESRLFNVSRFEDLREFHFQRRSRTLKLWDEALIPWQELILTLDDIACLPRLVRRYNPALAERLLEISEDVRKTNNGKYELPDLVSECGFRHEDFKKDVLARRRDFDNAWELIRTLVSLCGKTVRVSKDQSQNTVLSWRNHIPDDFLPALIFDASGRVRSMYERYAARTSKLEIITDATKRYDNVIFHHVNIAGSKDGWRRQAEKLFTAIGHCINNEPGRPCLVIHHKEEMESTFNPARRFGGRVPDIASELMGQVTGSDVVSFLTWGMHKQTNAYEHLDKLVLAGLLYLPQRTIEVRTMGCHQLSSDDAVRPESLREIELGELKNDVLQAVGRICIRRCEKGAHGEAQAPKADVYIMAANRAGFSIPDLLRDLFPGCKVKTHRVPGSKLRKWELALDALDKRTEGVSELSIPHAQIMADVGIKVRTNFTRDVRNDPGFRVGLKERNITDFGAYFFKYSF